jgi:tRNA pseudouridine55 synthase
MTGCLLIHKNPGLTSFESLAPVKKALGTGKVCHTGTLDKFARGLLVILTGRAVKLFPWFSGCDKRYRALLRFGEETDTLDPEGTVAASGPVPSREAVESLFPAFTGTIEQAPPAYSAVHINGKRSHELARQGKALEMKPRPVTIYRLELLTWDPPQAELGVHCSSGTYIRSLARDLALACGSRAHLRELTRTAVGNFFLEDALDLPEEASRCSGLTGAADLIRAAVKPLDGKLFHTLGIPSRRIDEETARRLSQGRDLRGIMAQFPDAPASLAFFGPGGFAALVAKQDGRWRYGYVG